MGHFTKCLGLWLSKQAKIVSTSLVLPGADPRRKRVDRKPEIIPDTEEMDTHQDILLPHRARDCGLLYGKVANNPGFTGERISLNVRYSAKQSGG